mgnify:CR=1 FL=1
MSEIKIIPGLLSDLYHIFSAPRRCYAIQLLSQCGCEEYAVRELAREITAIEEGISKDNASGEPYRNVYNALSQTHLRTMARYDLIDYQQKRQIVKPKWRLRLAALLINLNHVTYFLARGKAISDQDHTSRYGEGNSSTFERQKRNK